MNGHEAGAAVAPPAQEREETLDVRLLWAVFVRNWWLLVLGILASGAIAYALNATAVPLYTATAKVLVQGSRTPGTPTASDIQANRQLAQEFADLITTRPILTLVAEDPAFPNGVSGLGGKIRVRTPRTLMHIDVTDPDPQQAALLANKVATIFIEEFERRQLSQIAQFQASLSQYGIERDASIVAAQASTLSTLSVVEEAIEPSTPSSPRTRRNVLLAALAGLLASGVLVLIREYLDDTVRSFERLGRFSGIPALSIIPQARVRKGSASSGVTLAKEGRRSSFVEAFKFLQTNLEFAKLGTEGLKSLVVTSSGPGEGKTTVASNLATSVAQEGRTVILVDTDLRRPALARVFGLQDHKGLSHVLLGAATLDEVLADTGVPGLRVVSAGLIPPDPTVVLRSTRMKELVAELERRADLVIYDAPPLLAVTDPMLLGPLVDGALLVLAWSKTRRQALLRALEVLEHGGVPVVGAVLNKVQERDRRYYYSYYYHYYGTDKEGKRTQSRDGKRGVLTAFGRLVKRGAR